MPIDASIPLQTQNQDFGNTLVKGMSLKAMMQQEQLGQMQMAEMQRKQTAQKTLSTIMADPKAIGQDGSFTPEARDAFLKNGGDYTMLLDAQKPLMEVATKKKEAVMKMMEKEHESFGAMAIDYEKDKQTLGPAADQAWLPKVKALQDQLHAEYPELKNEDFKLDEKTLPEFMSRMKYSSESYRKYQQQIGVAQAKATASANAPITPYQKERLAIEGKKADASIAGKGSLSPDALKLAVEQYRAGDKSAAQGYARNSQMKSQFQNELANQAKEAGESGRDIAAKVAEFAGTTAGERALGTRTAQVGLAVAEAQKMIPLALAGSEAANRTGMKSLNDVQQAVQKGTASPELRKFVAANNSLVNIYSRAISPTGVPTVSDKDHAREVLSTAFSKGDYKAAVEQLQAEMKAAQESPATVRGEFRESVTGKGDKKRKVWNPASGKFEEQ